MSIPLSGEEFYGGASIEFRAKLPDDISADEIAALMNAIATLDAGAVTSVRQSPEALLLNFPVRSVYPSNVIRVRYGSDFQVVLDVVANAGVPTSLVVGAWIGITKGLEYFANARLRNEERKGKREERLARRAERARAQETVDQRYYFSLGSIGFEIRRPDEAFADEPAYVEPREIERAQDRRDEALDLLAPPEAREAADAALAAGLNTEDVLIALSQLSEYDVTIQITGTRPTEPQSA